MYYVLTTNIESIEAEGLQAKEREISVAVKSEDLENGVNNPKFYAFRYGMVYDPADGFKPNIAGKQKIKDYHIESYYQQLIEARKEYDRLLDILKGAGNSGEKGSNGPTQEEIDKLNRVIDHRNKQVNEMSAEVEKLKKELENTKEKDGKSEIDKMAEMVKALHEVQSRRIEIKINNEPLKTIEEPTHELFEKILSLLAKDQAVYLHGPAGTGKSKLAEQIAKALGLEFYLASTLTQEFKLSGFIDGNGVFHETNFYKAFVNGGVFFLDEMDSCTPEVLVGINGALANGIYDFATGSERAHENFRVISAGNTVGRGGDMTYTGRFALDMSTLDRFWAIKLDYSPTIDMAVAKGDKELVEFAIAVRNASKETGVVILMSYRSISRIAGFQNLFTLPEIMEMAVIKGVPSDDTMMLARNMKIDSNNKYYKAFKKAS